MAEEERNKKNNELKIKKKDYKGYDDEEFGDGQSGVRRSILAKYDEDLEGTSEIVCLSSVQPVLRTLNSLFFTLFCRASD